MTAVIVIATIVANLSIALADFASAKFVLNNSAEVGVSTRWLPMLGALKAAGAAGLLLGLLAVRPIGIAAALGLVVFFISAFAAHVRGPECSTTSPFRWGIWPWRSRRWCCCYEIIRRRSGLLPKSGGDGS